MFFFVFLLPGPESKFHCGQREQDRALPPKAEGTRRQPIASRAACVPSILIRVRSVSSAPSASSACPNRLPVPFLRQGTWWQAWWPTSLGASSARQVGSPAAPPSGGTAYPSSTRTAMAAQSALLVGPGGDRSRCARSGTLDQPSLEAGLRTRRRRRGAGLHRAPALAPPRPTCADIKTSLEADSDLGLAIGSQTSAAGWPVGPVGSGQRLNGFGGGTTWSGMANALKKEAQEGACAGLRPPAQRACVRACAPR